MRSSLLAIVVAIGLCLAGVVAQASGSSGPGFSNLSSRGVYGLGKSVTFGELVCRRCPIPKRGFNRERAHSVKASLEAVFDAPPSGLRDDDNVRVLLTGSKAENAAKVNSVLAYLNRRYRL